MSEYEPGDPNNYPAQVALVDDATPPTAANINLGYVDLADRTAWLRSKLVVLERVEILINATVTAPEGADVAIVEGCGGGGGGGGGLNFQSADNHTAGGGGGGGALRGLRLISVVPGDDYEVTIGSGGPGGAVGANGTNGQPTSMMHVPTEELVAIFAGGEGGLKGKVSLQGPNGYTWGLGGRPAAYLSLSQAVAMDVQDLPDLYRASTPQHGGAGVTGNNNTYRQDGVNSPHGMFGGSSGTPNGTEIGSYRGGGAGGGGGAGAYGNGASGGDGGSANNAGPSTGATAGASAAANTGAGGGGGGSSGNATTGGTGGAGGNGGIGRLVITWLKRGAL